MEGGEGTSKGKRKAPREMDFDKYPQKTIALKVPSLLPLPSSLFPLPSSLNLAPSYRSFTLDGIMMASLHRSILNKLSRFDLSVRLCFLWFPQENHFQGQLFNALMKVKLIKDKNSCSYTRCGRTDKGVSAFGQVLFSPSL